MPDLDPIEDEAVRNDNVREESGRDACCIIQQQILSKLADSVKNL